VSVYDCEKPGTFGIANRILWGNRQSSFKLSASSTCHRGRCVHNTQQTQQTNIHAPGAIRTRDPSSREASDREEYRFHGLWHNRHLLKQRRNQEFFSGGVQQVQLRTEERTGIWGR